MIRSAIGTTPTIPGPFTPVMRPRRKTTIRVYSGTTRNGRNVPCILAGPLIAVPPCDSVGIGLAVELRDGLDHEGQALRGPDHDLRPHGRGAGRVVTEGRGPVLTLDPHLSVRVQGLGHDRGFAEQGLGAAGHGDPLGLPRGPGDD